MVRWLAEETGLSIKDARDTNGKQETFKGADPLIYATPDAFVLDDHGDPIASVDVKVPHRTWTEWFDEANRLVIPDRYVCQLTWQINACQTKLPKVKRGLIGAFLDGEMKWKWIERDHGLEDDLISVAHEFWGHVEKREPPPIDGSESYSRFLGRRFPHASRPMLEQAHIAAPLLADVTRYLHNADEARTKRDAGEAAYKEAQNYLKALLGEHGGLIVENIGKVTWTNNKDGEKTDWEMLAKELLGLQPPERADELSAKHSHKTHGARVMRIKMEK
jgi:hypothetical protein